MWKLRKATAGQRLSIEDPVKGSLRGLLGCHLVKGRTDKAGEGGWGQTMKGSECLPTLNSEDNGNPSKVSKWRRETTRDGHR